MNKLQNKVAVITGGNSGIGFGIAEAFKNESATGAIIGRNQKTLSESVAQLGNDFIAINADVTNLSDLERTFKETADKFGKIDVLVANAGAGTTGTVADLSEADYDKTMDLNLKSVYFTVQKALPYMNDGGVYYSHRVECSTPGLPFIWTLRRGKSCCDLFSKKLFKRPLRKKDQVNVSRRVLPTRRPLTSSFRQNRSKQ
jgi:NAD(P)-dependent dehydrogenase (short-subunit alcohol dehydrogenase family)